MTIVLMAGGRCLHDTTSGIINPYQRVISIVWVNRRRV
jgi:hypothetical protein